MQDGPGPSNPAAGISPLEQLQSLKALQQRQREYVLGRSQYERDMVVVGARTALVEEAALERSLLQEEQARLQQQLVNIQRDLATASQLELKVAQWKEEAVIKARASESLVCGPLKDAVDELRASHHLPRLQPLQTEREGKAAVYLEERRQQDLVASAPPVPKRGRPRGRPRGSANANANANANASPATSRGRRRSAAPSTITMREEEDEEEEGEEEVISGGTSSRPRAGPSRTTSTAPPRENPRGERRASRAPYPPGTR